MKVWWCDVHKSGYQGEELECDSHALAVVPINDCNLVEMQLVPADARMVSGELERAARALQDWDIDGGVDWWVSEHPEAEGEREYYRDGVRAVLDALSEPPPKDPWDYDP